MVVVGPDHPLASRTWLQPEDLAGARWVAGPGGVRAGQRGATLGRDLGRAEEYASEATALRAARTGGGVLLALAHTVRDDVRRGTLVRLPVDGTPVTGLWWATVPGDGRATTAARALQRFLTTRDATTALLSRPARRASAPTVRVELWS